MSIRKILTAAGAALLLTTLGATAAHADDSNPSGDTIVVSGQELGAADGLNVVTQSFPVASGGEVGATFASTPPQGASTQEVWGSSYAFSNEVHYTSYIGYGKAGANVYNGERIVRVCFWWTQAERTSATTCADATFSGGSWYASDEVTSTFDDSLDTYAPQTIFNIQTSRIDPRG